MTYTNEQVRQFAKATRHSLWPDQLENLRLMLRDLDEAGITVQFPERRYYVVRDTDRRDTPRRYVRDRMDGDLNVAWFYGPRAEQHAREHADRLNREAP